MCAHGSTLENHLGFGENQRRPSRLPDLTNSFHYHSPSSLCTFWPPSRERTLVKMPGCAVVMGISLSLTEENPGNKRQAVENGFVALLHFEKITDVLLALKELSYFPFCSMFTWRQLLS